MIKTELSYNPYLMKTEVKFNGHAPRINSLVEKYDSLMLQRWMHLVPQIFYDEMNGYDFELEFSGTRSDFLELRNVFLNAGVTEREVRLIFKNEVTSREETIILLRNLFAWLNKNRNRKFNYDTFVEKYKDSFEESYPFIVLYRNFENIPSLEELHFNIENINDVEELKNTILTNTPILYCITKESLKTLPQNLKTLVSRKDIIKEQLFFNVSEELNANKIERVLKDLGMQDPQIVENIDEECIVHYLKVYPISAYIYNVLSIFKHEFSILEKNIKADSAKAAISNREIYNRLNTLDCELEKLKNALEKFEQRDNVTTDSSMFDEKEVLINKISNWKNRKTKISNQKEAYRVADEFDNDVHRFYQNYMEAIREEMYQIRNLILTEYQLWYQNGSNDFAFKITDGNFPTVKQDELPSFSKSLISMSKSVEHKYAEAKADLIGRLFNSKNAEEREVVMQDVWYYEEWREYVISVVNHKVDEVPKEAVGILCEYSDYLAKCYIDRLNSLINDKIAEKNREASRLSVEEKLLQEDNDWVTTFIDEIERIERG